MTLQNFEYVEDKNLFTENGEALKAESVRYRGLAIGHYPNVQRAGWFYKVSNKMSSLKLVQIDKMLIWWGIRSQTWEESKGTKRRTFNRVASQQVVLYFMLAMFCRWFILTLSEVFTIRKDVHQFLGDFMDGYGTVYSRLYYKAEILFFASVTLLIHVLMVCFEKSTGRNMWLEIVSFMNKKQTQGTSGLPEGVATNVWNKSIRNIKISMPIVAGGLASIMSGIILECQFYRGSQTVQNWIWTVVDCIWLALLSLHFTGFVFIFDIFAHYFDVRAQKLIFDSEQIYKYRNEIRVEERNNVIWSMLKDFNSICVELRQVDHFWQYFLISMLQVGPFAILMGLNSNLVFGTRMDSSTHYATIWILTLVLFALWIIFVMRASRLATQMHRFYLVLNRVCLIPVNDSMKLRMEHAVKRFDGLHLGFNCFHMFTVGHEYLYHVSYFQSR